MNSDQILYIMLDKVFVLLLWQVLSLKIGTAITVLIAIVIILLRKFSRLKNQKAELQRLVNERSELLKYSVEREKKARDSAAEANRTKSLLLARINHEIRTPLNGVLGMASLLAETSLTPEQSEYRDTIQDCGDSLLKVVNDILLSDILDYSKVESGKMELEQKDFDLENCIEEVLDIFAVKAAQRNVELIYELDVDVPHQIIGDHLRLRQILMNLVENSLRFTREGEILISVHLRANENKSLMLAFNVKDSGAGIAPEKLKALSASLTNTGSHIDTGGVGLVISKKLAALMGGTITIESQPGKGTLITFTIRTAAGKQTSRSAQALTPLEGKKILVAESNEHLAHVLNRQLQEWKVVTTIAPSGNAAREILTYESPDLLLVSLSLSDMTAVEFAQSVRQKYPGLPIVLLAPAGNNTGKQHAELFDATIVKPIKSHVLSKQILSYFIHPDSITTEAEPSAQHKLSADFAEQYPLRILIAEDNLINQKLAVKVLNKLGYKPDVVQHGKAVLDIVSHKHYDLILMDVQMPEMDGLEASRMIRLCLDVQPVIIAMTANTLQGDREACLQAGMDDYISKPINLEELVNILEKWAFHIREKK